MLLLRPCMPHNQRFAASLLSTTRTGAFLPFFSVSLLGKVSYINVIAARAVEHVGGLSYPFVGDPLWAEDDWTSTVKHEHVWATAPFEIMPENGWSFLWPDGHSKPRKGRRTPFGHLGQIHHEGCQTITGWIGRIFLFLHTVDDKIGLLVNEHGILVTLIMPSDAVIGHLQVLVFFFFPFSVNVEWPRGLILCNPIETRRQFIDVTGFKIFDPAITGHSHFTDLFAVPDGGLHHSRLSSRY